MSRIEIHYVTDAFGQTEIEKMKTETLQGEGHSDIRQARYKVMHGINMHGIFMPGKFMPGKFMPYGSAPRRRRRIGDLISGLFGFRVSSIWEWDSVFEAGEAGFGAGRIRGFETGSAAGYENDDIRLLHLICHSLPVEWPPEKKERMIYTLQSIYGPLWLEDKLAAALHMAQPNLEYDGETGTELLSFRTLYLAKKQGWSGEALVVALEEPVREEKTAEAKEDTAIGTEMENAAEKAIEEAAETEKLLALKLILSLSENLNYLTIAGGRPEMYEELAELLWQENGLPVRFLESPVREYVYGPEPLVLHLQKKRRIRPNIFGPGAKCVEVYAAVPKFLDTMARNGYNS